MASSITTGTTTDSSVTTGAFRARISRAETIRKAPPPAAYQPISRFFVSAFHMALRKIPRMRITAPKPAKIQRYRSYQLICCWAFPLT